MTSLRRLAALTVVGVAAIVAASLPAQAAAPILVKSCTIVKPKPLSHMAGGTRIVYVNLGKKTAAEVTFVVGYRNASSHYLRRVQDVGSFAPGATTRRWPRRNKRAARKAVARVEAQNSWPASASSCTARPPPTLA